MDFIPDQETLIFWLTQYGSIALFVLLAFGIIALPIPEETLMVLAGLLVHKGHLVLIPTLLAAYGGSVSGITVSYLIGRIAGNFVVRNYGSWIGLTESRFLKFHNWFERYGKWTLVIGYFVPGLRHWTGVFAGITYLEYPYFALYAYTGALIWVVTFISIGYFFGMYWLPFLENFEIRIDILTVILVVFVALLLIWRYWPNGKNGRKR